MLPKFTLGGQDGDRVRTGSVKYETLSRRNSKHTTGMAIAGLMVDVQKLQRDDDEPSKAQLALIGQINGLIKEAPQTTVHMAVQYARRFYLWDPRNSRQARYAWAEEHIRPLVKDSKDDSAKLDRLQKPGKNDVYDFMQLRGKSVFDTKAANDKWTAPENSYVFPWFSRIVTPKTKWNDMASKSSAKVNARGRDPPKSDRARIDEVYDTVVPDVLDKARVWIAEAKKVDRPTRNHRFYLAYLVVSACTGRRQNEILHDDYAYTVVDDDFMEWRQLSKQRGGGVVASPQKTPLLGAADSVGHALEYVRMVGLSDNSVRNWLKLNYPEFADHVKARGTYALRVWERRKEFGYEEGATKEQVRKEALCHESYDAGAHYVMQEQQN
jgi:hypothetical protein